MKLVTGGAGFIGSHLVDALVARGDKVRVLDNLRVGSRDAIAQHLKTKAVAFQRGSVMSKEAMRRALRGVDEVWHLAADPDVRAGVDDPWSNFRDGAVATFDVLDAMRRADVKRIVFSSSSVVYGETDVLPTPEDHGPCLPISAYGASKLAAEACISSFVGTYGMQAWVYRFGNVVGPRLTHGVVYDFHKHLAKNPRRLPILGDGSQEKSYLSTQDCIEGMLHGRDFSNGPFNLFNLASRDATTVRRIADIVIAAHGLRNVKLAFSGGSRGWAGDVRKMRLAVDRMAAIGWKPRHGSDDAVRMAAEWVARQR